MADSESIVLIRNCDTGLKIHRFYGKIIDKHFLTLVSSVSQFYFLFTICLLNQKLQIPTYFVVCRLANPFS